MLVTVEERGTIEVNGLTFDVFVVGRRKRYGHIDLAVTPVSGSGKRWVESSKVTLFDRQLPNFLPLI